MSARNNNTKQQPAKKPFCKVCQDAGKSESEYTSHYVRSLPDRSGKTTVTCPTLLATECRFCFGLGHTTKFCPVLAANKKQEERKFAQEKRMEADTKKSTQQPKKVSNKFCVLQETISDSEEDKKPVAKEVQKEVKEEFPALSSTMSVAKPVMSGWASVAAKSAAEYENEKYQQELIANSIKRQMPPIKKTVVVPQVKKSWADWSDSEDEEYEEAYEQAAVAVKTMKASEMDWAMKDDESDEDW
jgi:hypothetical protein